MCYVIIIGSSAPDWICNTAQGMGYVTPQYDAAMDIGSSLPKDFVQLNDAVTIDKITGWAITGHSLGGGLASAAAGVCGKIKGPGYIGNNSVSTFNAAGLHNDTVRSYLSRRGLPDPAPGDSPSITAYRTESDILTVAQEKYNIGPVSKGSQYWLEDAVDLSISSLFSGHEMKSVIQGLLVDRIGKHVGITYIIDSNDLTYCFRGKHGKLVIVGDECYYEVDGVMHDLLEIYNFTVIDNEDSNL